MFTYNITVGLLKFLVARLTASGIKAAKQATKYENVAYDKRIAAIKSHGMGANLKGLLPKEDK